MEQSTHTITRDHDEIRTWVENNNGTPVIIFREKNSDEELLAIKFSDEEKGENISWQEFFERFDDASLALRYNVSEEEKGIFSYNLITHLQAEVDDDVINKEDEGMPEDDIPSENVFPSAPENDESNPDNAGTEGDTTEELA